MKKIILTSLLVICIIALSVTVCGAATKTVYVSSAGNDSNAGTSADAPVATLTAAYNAGATDIVLLDDTVYYNAPSNYSGNITIKGGSQSVKLLIGGTDVGADARPNLKGDLTLDNLTVSGSIMMYANGHKFKVTETVLSDEALSVCGGNWSTFESTYLELLGGRWATVYGGSWTQHITGNTNVIIGGNFNYGYTLADCQDEICTTKVYGGCFDGEVRGKTNVTIKGNAVVQYVYGASRNDSSYEVSNEVYDTNINIEGGTIMNVYGGSETVALSDCTTHITMTGGTVEAIFGGSAGTGMTGHTYVNLYGGNLVRRVFSGCYNGTSGLSLSSTNYVNGTTTLTLAPGFNASLSDSQEDRGIYAGSRVKNQNSAEKNTIIFLDNCYSTFSSKLGDQSGYSWMGLASHPNYTVKAGVNGDVYGTDVAGEVLVVADKGYYGKVGSDTTWYKNDIATVGSTTDITFLSIADNFNIAEWIAGNGDYTDFMIVDTGDLNASMMTYQVIEDKTVAEGFTDELTDIPNNSTEISVTAETLNKDIEGIEYGILYAHGVHDVLDFTVDTAKVHKLSSLDLDGGVFGIRVVDTSGETNKGTICTYVKYGDTYRFGTPVVKTLIKCAFFESASRGTTYYVFSE